MRPSRSFAAFAALAALAALAACGSPEPAQDTADARDTGAAARDTGADTGDTAPPDTGTAWWETGTGDSAEDPDLDEDGYSAAEDCDDLDAAVHPGAFDDCDGHDADCDDEVDEDFDGDAWEPNDRQAAWLGEATEDASVVVVGYLFGEDDEDGFAVNVEDSPWTWFSVEAWLYGVPADADYAIEMRWVEDLDGVDRGVVATADEAGAGGDEVADWPGLVGEDNSGRYEVWVTSTDGAACATAYTLEIVVGGW